MRIQDKVKKCVAFVAMQMADKSFRIVGTVFFVGRDQQKNTYSYAVTAKHVIKGIKSKGLEKVFLRLNLTNGACSMFPTNASDWIYHEDGNVDIAVHPIGLTPEMDHLLYPESSFLTEKLREENEVNVGDEVFIAGLFKYHYGVQKNLPIIRIGNISAMPNEKVEMEDRLMDAYLIEARSIGGLSGSPVFTNLGIVRQLGGEIKHRQGEELHNLLGLICGHYDSSVSQIDQTQEDSDENERVNTGIAIVTPVEKLMDFFQQESIKKSERNIDDLISKKVSASEEV